MALTGSSAQRHGARYAGGVLLASVLALALVAPACTSVSEPLEEEAVVPSASSAPPVVLPSAAAMPQNSEPWMVVLGVAQDAGVPQAGAHHDPAWSDPGRRRYAAALGLVDPATSSRWIFEATPDFKDQFHALDEMATPAPAPALNGIFLTHGHIGHYTGLMHLGHEAMGAAGISVYAMPRMMAFLSSNGPWDQLVRYGNIRLRPLADGASVALGRTLSVTPLQVPHRDEYTEVVGYHIQGPRLAVLFLPDIDKWAAWDQQGTRIEDILRTVDVAYLDGTFFADGELPGRDMSAIRHPFIVQTMERLSALPEAERAKVRFIHLNHSNPALWAGSDAWRTIQAAGFSVAVRGEVVGL